MMVMVVLAVVVMLLFYHKFFSFIRNFRKFLIFNHWNIFSISHWQRITDAGHPTWDRLNGELLSFRYNNKDILDFLKDNCIGRFYLKNNNRVFFQRMQDYIIAKTAFCVGD